MPNLLERSVPDAAICQDLLTSVAEGPHDGHVGRVAGVHGGQADLLRDLRAADGDPIRALHVVARYQRLLHEVATRAVTVSRRTGKSWDEVAAALGTSRQAAWQHYRNVDPPERTSCLVMRRFPNRRRRHLAIRAAILEDYGIRISERAAHQLTKRLTDIEPGLHEVVVLDGRDPSSGERVSKKVSLHALSVYLMPFPEAKAQELRLLPMLDD
jgi:hypothetical protein